MTTSTLSRPESVAYRTTTTKLPNRNFGLDLFRAVAVSLVILAHFLKQYEYFGFFGVELFFALSGYLIGQILWRNFSSSTFGIQHITNFWSRRWWRTLPNYYLFLIVSLILVYFMNGGLPGWQTVSKYLWFGQNLLERDRAFYGVSWSLCVEEWFYLLFPSVLFIVSRFKMSKKLAFAITLAVFFIGSIAMRMYVSYQGNIDELRLITLTRLDSIAFGVAIAFITSIYSMSTFVKIAAFVFGGVLYLSPLYYPETVIKTLENPTFLVIVPFGASFLIPWVATIRKPDGILRGVSKSIENISLWSYSIYLSHIPVLFFTYFVFENYRDSLLGNLASKAVGIVLTLAISYILYRYVEMPLMHKRPKELRD